MKNLFLFIVALVALFLFSARSLADDAFAGAGTAVSTNLSWYVPSMKPGGVPIIAYVNATSDLTTSVIKFYSAGAPVAVSTVSSNGQTTITAPGGALSASNVIVVRSLANDTYQRLVVSSATSSNIVSTTNLAFDLAVGDPVYKMTANGTIPLGNTTAANNGTNAGLYYGTKGRPTLIDVNGTASASINLISGKYLH